MRLGWRRAAGLAPLALLARGIGKAAGSTRPATAGPRERLMNVSGSLAVHRSAAGDAKEVEVLVERVEDVLLRSWLLGVARLVIAGARARRCGPPPGSVP